MTVFIPKKKKRKKQAHIIDFFERTRVLNHVCIYTVYFDMQHNKCLKKIIFYDIFDLLL